jgi:hypothetical protein
VIADLTGKMYFGTAAVNKNTLAAVISEIHFVELGDQR